MFLFSKEEDSPRVKQLRALSLFSTLSPRELKTVDGLLHERSYLEDEVIFDQGEEGQALYIPLLEQVKGHIGARQITGDNRIAKVSVVGVGMRSHVGIASKMFRTLAEEGINIQMISTSEIKISVVIDEKYLELAVRVLHKAFELDQVPA